MPKMTSTSFDRDPVIEEDRYPATLKEANEYEKEYNGEIKEKIAWVFEVEVDPSAIESDPDGAFNGKAVEIALHTSKATGKNSKFKSAGLADVVPEDWDLDTDNCIGMEVMADVVQYTDGNGAIRNGIDKVRPPKKGKKAKKEAAPKSGKDEVTLDESDFEDIEF